MSDLEWKKGLEMKKEVWKATRLARIELLQQNKRARLSLAHFGRQGF
jgi:hypothetical protein